MSACSAHAFVSAILHGTADYADLHHIRAALEKEPYDIRDALFDDEDALSRWHEAQRFRYLLADCDGDLDFERIRFESYNREKRDRLRQALLRLTFLVGSVNIIARSLSVLDRPPHQKRLLSSAEVADALAELRDAGPRLVAEGRRPFASTWMATQHAFLELKCELLVDEGVTPAWADRIAPQLGFLYLGHTRHAFRD